MKKIISFVLTLALLVSVLAVMPLAAENGSENGYYVHLDQGITLVHRHGETEEPLSVAAKEIGDVKEFSCGCKNSVNSYVDGLLDVDKSTHTKALVDALLNYGAAAQNYFGYKTDALVGTPVEDTAALKAVTPAEPVINDDAGIYMGASLLLEGTIRLRFYFMRTDISVKVDGKAEEVKTGKNYSYVDVPVMPYDMEKAVTVTVDGTDTSVSYAPINYLKNKVNDPEISVMVASIYAYGVAAEEYRESASVEPDGAEVAATEIFLSPDSWTDYKYGAIDTKTPTEDSITIQVKGINAKSDEEMTGMQLSKAAIKKMIDLGFHYLSFTVTLAKANAINAPKYVDVYNYESNNDYFTSSYDYKHGNLNEFYYESGSEIGVDLCKLYDNLTHEAGYGLIFILSSGRFWQPTDGGSITFSNVKFSTEIEQKETERVLLVSIDGLSASVIDQTRFSNLKSISAYTLLAQTINPSLTLPAHMSMTHGVTPTTHGVTKNTYTPSESLGNGIFETVSAAGLTSAMFYDWEQLGDLVTEDTRRVGNNYISKFNNKGEQDFSASVSMLSDAVIDHMTNYPTDFTFLYYGLPDDTGENRGGWSSQNYITAVNTVYNSLINVLSTALSLNYTIIITADHGGGGYNGDNKHGSTAPEDMYIPLFIMDPSLQSADLGDGVSILDVAPTVADLLGIEAETYWVGRSLVSDDSVAKREDMATNLFFSEDAWADYDYGAIENTTVSNGSITMELSGASMSSKYPGMSTLQLTKDAIGEMISLGYHYLSFTMTLEGVEGGNTPNYVDVYIGNYNAKYNFHVSTPDSESPEDPGEFYYANGREVIVDLWALYQRLTSNIGLIFALSAGLHWKATYGGRITFSDVKLAESLSEYKSNEELAALDVFFNSNTWVQYSAHGKINSLKTIGTTLTVDVTNNGSTNFAGMQLSRAAVREMLDLGFTSLSFKMDYEKGSTGITPGYACVYGINSKEHQVDLDFLGKDGRSDYYYKDGERIEIDLRGLYDALLDGYVFVFVLTTKANWVTSGSSATTTKDGYFIFSNIEFS